MQSAMFIERHAHDHSLRRLYVEGQHFSAVHCCMFVLLKALTFLILILTSINNLFYSSIYITWDIGIVTVLSSNGAVISLLI